jgi:hypothetical protein
MALRMVESDIALLLPNYAGLRNSSNSSNSKLGAPCFERAPRLGEVLGETFLARWGCIQRGAASEDVGQKQRGTR